MDVLGKFTHHNVELDSVQFNLKQGAEGACITT
jgi:hypothetical protein